MKKTIILAVMFLFFTGHAYANPVCERDREQARADAREYISEKYDLNYAIRSLLKHNMKAYDEICALLDDEQAKEKLEVLMRYYPDFSAILSSYKSGLSVEELQEREDSRPDVFVPIWYH